MKNEKLESKKELQEKRSLENQEIKKDIAKEIAKNSFDRLGSFLSDHSLSSGRNGGNNQSLYKMDAKEWESMQDAKKSQYRGKMRRILAKFNSDILGLDRNESERIKSCKSFIAFQKEFYINQNLDYSSIYQGSNEKKIKDHKEMIGGIKSLLKIK